MIFILLFLIAVMAILFFSLRKSMKKTIYSYRNIVLIGSLLFVFALTLICGQFCMMLPAGVPFTAELAYDVIIVFPRLFSYYAVFVIIVVCTMLGISNISLMRHEGFHMHNALSVLVAALYIGGTLGIYQVADKLMEYVFIPLELYLKPMFIVLNTVIPLYCIFLLCYLECILAGSAILGWIAARRVPCYNKDYIIILGCSIDKQGGLLPLLKGRVNRAIRFAAEQKNAVGKQMVFVPSGGQGSDEIISEGSAMELYLLSHGEESENVIPEKESRNTWENFCFSKKLIDERTPNAKVAFATTNYHILRSGILARKAGLDAEGIAGDTKWYFWPNGFIREFFGILVMEKRVHIRAAALLAILCAAAACFEYMMIV